MVINLPNPGQITRRYMCSYVSPESLMPPLELISCAAIARERHNFQVALIDAIAENLTIEETITRIENFNPDIVLSLTGFECFEEDMDAMCAIRSNFPEKIFVFFGHYATHFPEETLRHSGVNFVILGEPEIVLDNLLSNLVSNLFQLDERIEGIGQLLDGVFVKTGSPSRIKDPNDLPIPAYDLLPRDGNYYYEPLFANPYGMIQTMRGCPYQCNYCVKSYGSKLSQLSVERIVKEIKIWKSLFGVKSIRFIDDTFTLNKGRTIDLCKAIIENQLHIEWACLSRTDNLDEELLVWMKKSGCKRIYFGMETGSQRMLDIYKKSVKKEEALAALLLCRSVGIETAAFFMSGHPDENENDFIETLAFAKAAKLNFASFNPLTPYPGTGLFDQVKHLIDFEIYPYKNRWKDEKIYDKFDSYKLKFYKGFYLRPSYWVNNLTVLRNNFFQIWKLGIGMLRYLFWDKQFVISGLKGEKDKL
jgi:radical SAM superfamily enzyme YgiQ (UPF0313 family)